MWVLPLVGYTGVVLGFAFLTLAIASGLYYLSELVEEHTVSAKKFLTRLIYSTTAFLTLLLLIDRFPLWPSLLSIVSHGIYLQNLRRFPLVQLSDHFFILSCLLVLVNHWVWFTHFSTPPSLPPTHSSLYASAASQSLPTFTEIASFFGLCVWLVPFALFVSLSASDNVLPSAEFESPFSPSNTSFPQDGLRAGGISSSTGGGGGGMSSSMAAMLTPSRGSFPIGSMARSPRGSPSGLRNGSLGHTGGASGRRKGGAKGMVRVAVDGVREWVSETGEVMGLWRGERTRRW
ncbi:erv26 super protein [Agyrium rufum]|nr:erv26 super protein [Agyrium rufum]